MVDDLDNEYNLSLWCHFIVLDHFEDKQTSKSLETGVLCYCCCILSRLICLLFVMYKLLNGDCCWFDSLCWIFLPMTSHNWYDTLQTCPTFPSWSSDVLDFSYFASISNIFMKNICLVIYTKAVFCIIIVSVLKTSYGQSNLDISLVN